MSENEFTNELLPLFKAMADKNRLKVIGLLAQRPHTVEELAAALNIGASTTSHHLSVLGKAGLVEGKVRGYYSVYSLQTNPLEEMAKRLLKPEKLQGLAETASAERSPEEAYAAKVLAAFTTPEGRIKAFPMQEKKFLVLLRHVLAAFEPGVQYTEKQVNTILMRFNKDTAKLRRALVDHKYMDREGGGGKYWRR